MYNEEYFFGKKNKYDTSTSIKKHKHNNISGGAVPATSNPDDFQIIQDTNLLNVPLAPKEESIPSSESPRSIPESLREIQAVDKFKKEGPQYMAERTNSQYQQKILNIIKNLEKINNDNDNVCDAPNIKDVSSYLKERIHTMIDKHYDIYKDKQHYRIIIPSDTQIDPIKNQCNCALTQTFKTIIKI